jgi:2-succinyl-6-hydroxy-2,4-cyclohexadiene-1-carboxylate synthase
MALQIAVSVPERISALIIESASPGILEPESREQRIGNDNQIADMIEREGVKAFVDYWEKAPIFATQKGLSWEVLRRQREQRLKNNPKGLANSLRGAGAGQQQPLHAELPNLNMPVLLLAGQYDQKYIELAIQMNNLIPNSQLKIVGGTGHTIHLERPQEYDRLVLEFLNSVEF